MALALAGCSGGGESGEAGAETSAALKVCEEVFGADGVSAARAALGDSDFRAESYSPDRIRESMLKEARAYVPGSEDLSRSKHEPCSMSTADGEDYRRVDARVQWSLLTVGSVAEDVKSGTWHRIGEDLYVQWLKRVDGLAAVLPCQVSGAAAGQERALPLEIAVLGEGLGPDRERLSGNLLASLVRDTQKRLGCKNPVAVPASLLPK
ncbi:hypothetical protein ACFYUJ_35305 [Streptomyces sp. NPDC004520]|uniref:hypothetical protein n=1 Tax=Streptomyces sp. NPDC004520 TaxID=3364702 RepID=UPI00368C5B4F